MGVEKGFRRCRGFKGFRGGGIALAGDDYKCRRRRHSPLLSLSDFFHRKCHEVRIGGEQSDCTDRE